MHLHFLRRLANSGAQTLPEAQDTESFERLVSEEYSEIRASDEDEERLDYYALIDAVRDEVDVAGAVQMAEGCAPRWGAANRCP